MGGGEGEVAQPIKYFQALRYYYYDYYHWSSTAISNWIRKGSIKIIRKFYTPVAKLIVCEKE